jgi:hypothetical protein
MEYFERLVMAHINTIMPETLEPLQFDTAPTDPQITQSQSHSTLPFPTCNKRHTYVRMLFIDYSSAFNTIVPTKSITKLRNL